MAVVFGLFLATMCVIKRVRTIIPPSRPRHSPSIHHPIPLSSLYRPSHLSSPITPRPVLCWLYVCTDVAVVHLSVYSARRRNGSRRSTRSAAGGASSKPPSTSTEGVLAPPPVVSPPAYTRAREARHRSPRFLSPAFFLLDPPPRAHAHGLAGPPFFFHSHALYSPSLSVSDFPSPSRRPHAHTCALTHPVTHAHTHYLPPLPRRRRCRRLDVSCVISQFFTALQ